MKRVVLLLATLLVSASLALAADYQIDGAHSSANFTVRHLGISKVHGRFSAVTGTITFDDKTPDKSAVTAVIKATSVSTDNSMRDRHLNSPDFLDTAKFPEMKFQSTSVRHVSDDDYIAVGNLTIKDVTKQVEIPFTLSRGKGPRGEPRLGIDAAITINRFDYNVNYDKTGVTVGKEVKIELSVEAFTTT